MIGKLYIVATPIGNLKDITLRALEALEKADIIAAEDTRQSIKLLNHFNIKKPLISYHMHNERSSAMDLIGKLKEGKNVALVTDAGTPGISDPGSVIIRACIEENLPMEVIPGACASITALVYSGLDTTSFIFKGFLPWENKERKELILELKDRKETVIFYEAPHRLRATLGFLLDSFGNRKLSLCREMTKLHEEILRMDIETALKYYDTKEPKGEYVLIMEGKKVETIKEEEKARWEGMSIEEHIKAYMDSGMDKKEAIKAVAHEREIPKSDIYKYSLKL
ncbi:MAG TPA: 16S rRNA (cytidine(1402)-2'-O)-methyltransferase [Clostridiaceae bacterium]